MKIIKRDGKIEEFIPYKIEEAVKKAFTSESIEYDSNVFKNVLTAIDSKEIVSVEEIQDLIEKELHSLDYFNVMKSFMNYRLLHKMKREHILGLNEDTTYINATQTIEEYIGKSDWRIQANSNTGYSNAGLINNTAGKVIANYWLDKIYSKEEGLAHRNGDYHIHDLDCLTAYCFTGDTRIRLIDGSTPSFEELCKTHKNSDIWVLSVDQNGDYQVGRGHSPRVTRKNSNLIAVTLDNDEVIRCTPDHKFLLKNNTYKEAKDLVVGESLMPLYFSKSGKYLSIINHKKHRKSAPFIMVHKLAAKAYFGDSALTSTVHHKDENKINNFPDNLELVEDSVHRRDHLYETMETEKWKQANNKNISMRNKSQKMRQISHLNAIARNKTIEQKCAVSYSASKIPNKTNKEEYINFVNINGFISYKDYYNKFISNNGIINHKVKRVELLDYTEDVYDITVENYHNFALASGVVVHNCAGWSLRALLDEGFNGVRGRVEARAPSHFKEALGQMANFLGILQAEWAGAQAFSSFDTYLAPYVFKDQLSEKEVKKAIVSFIYNLNVPARWGQSPFTNITIDWTVPSDLKDQIPTKQQQHLFKGIKSEELLKIAQERNSEIKSLEEMTYKYFQKEMNMINKAYYEVMTEGDKTGQPFTFPIPTVNITEDFDWYGENTDILFENTAKIGSSYFQNFIGSQYVRNEEGKLVENPEAYRPGHVRSMCPFTPDTKLTVRLGFVEMDIEIKDFVKQLEIEDSNYEVLTPEGWRSAKPVKTPATKVYEIKLSNGISIKMGADHLQPIMSGETLHADQLKIGMHLPFSSKITSDMFFYKITDIKEIPYNEEFLYCIEVNNESHLFILANGLVTHNCRLQLDLRELLKRGGGLFGSAEMTGSLGVVTINMARLGYLYKDEEKLVKELDRLLDLAKSTLEKKRVFVQEMYDRGLYPYTARYLPGFRNHFSTIGVNGINEMIRNFTGDQYNITTKEGKEFAIKILNHIREKMVQYQEETGNLYNLEATPAEGTTYRFAKEDKKRYPDIIQAGFGDNIYYTNSSQVPANFTDDPFEALELQDDLQCKYTGGTVLHLYMRERLSSAEACRKLVKNVISNHRLPYITVTPVFSVCEKHGYLAGEHEYCPKCDEELLLQNKNLTIE